jgi:hypothetical protein
MGVVRGCKNKRNGEENEAKGNDAFKVERTSAAAFSQLTAAVFASACCLLISCRPVSSIAHHDA